jgi:beta-galactosidase GanA
LSIFENSENRYIKALFGSDSSVVYQSVSSKNINYSTLKEQNLVIFEQNEEIPSGLVQELVQYVKQGGNLLLLPSSNAASYNNTLNTALYVSTFGKLNASQTAVSTLNLQHALYKNVFEKYPENISLPAVFQYFESNKTITNNKEVAIRLENGDDFLVSHKVDDGNVFLLAVGLSDKFSDFQKHAIFVPSLYNMTLGNKQHQIYHTIASSNSIDLPNIYVPSDNVLEIKNKKTAFIPEIKRNIQGIQLYVHQQVRDAGNYLLWNSDTVLMGLSFNYSRKESDMQFLSVSQIKEYIAQYNSNNIKLLDIQNKPNALIEQQINSSGISLYAMFIILALLALLAEVVLLRVWMGK